MFNVAAIAESHHSMGPARLLIGCAKLEIKRILQRVSSDHVNKYCNQFSFQFYETDGRID